MVSKTSVLLFLSRYKYIIVLVLFLVNIGLWDENSIIHRIEHKREITNLQEEIEKYKATYTSDTEKLHRLQHDPSTIKRIARERYFMKMEDEDVYVWERNEVKDSDEE